MSARTRMTNLTPGYAINSIIAIAIMIGFKYVVTPSDPLTPLGVEILGIFLGVVWGWLLCGDIFWHPCLAWCSSVSAVGTLCQKSSPWASGITTSC